MRQRRRSSHWRGTARNLARVLAFWVTSSSDLDVNTGDGAIHRPVGDDGAGGLSDLSRIWSAGGQGMCELLADLTQDIEAANQRCPRNPPWRAESVGHFMQTVLPGGATFAQTKQQTKQNPRVAA
jgi:hypothetical protein